MCWYSATHADKILQAEAGQRSGNPQGSWVQLGRAGVGSVQRAAHASLPAGIKREFLSETPKFSKRRCIQARKLKSHFVC